MKYDKFKKIFNSTIFEKSKADLITKVSRYPQRYIGLFRPTKPKAKLFQNLLQSHEIRFGDAFEEVIEEYLKENGFEILEKVFTDGKKEELWVDQFFKKGKNYYFVEQKIRDDHDSTKKRGQISNFAKKLDKIIKAYGDNNLQGALYFIDKDLIKNRNFYQEELKKMAKDYGVDLSIYYGREFFAQLKIENVWNEIVDYLKVWRNELPEMPEINFDKEAEHSFEEIKDLPASVFRNLFNDAELFEQIVLTLFPQKKVLKLLADYFGSKEEKIYKTLTALIRAKL